MIVFGNHPELNLNEGRGEKSSFSSVRAGLDMLKRPKSNLSSKGRERATMAV